MFKYSERLLVEIPVGPFVLVLLLGAPFEGMAPPNSGGPEITEPPPP